MATGVALSAEALSHKALLSISLYGLQILTSHSLMSAIADGGSLEHTKFARQSSSKPTPVITQPCTDDMISM